MRISLMAPLCLFLTLHGSITASCQDNERVFDSLLASHFHADEPGAVVLAARDNDVLYRRAFGKADLELGVDMVPGHVFRLGSITKQFTACAILKLTEEGKLSLSDTVGRFIPDYPMPGRKITIEQLLTHTSGIRNYTGLAAFTPEVTRRDLSPEELIDLFKDEPLDFEPGREFRYSNSGYVLLGYIIEQVTGKSYAAYINETFFKPLDMDNSYYDDAALLMPHRARGYKPVYGGYENADFLSMTLPYAAGSLASDADDLLKWYSALVKGRILHPETLAKAWAPHRLADGKLAGYGYGWAIGNVQGSRSIKHVGVINGFVTYAAYLPQEQLYVSIFANRENAPDPDLIGSRMLAILLDHPYDFRETAMTPKELEPYQAVYRMADGGKTAVSMQDSDLMFYHLGGLKARLIPFKKDYFQVENTLKTLAFERDKRGSITGFTLNSTELPASAIRTDDKIKAMKTIQMTEAILSGYTGKYRFDQGPVFEVVLEGGKLYGQVGADKKELLPFGKDRFFARELDAIIIFDRDGGNRIAGFTKFQNGEMKAKKVAEAR